METRRGIWFGVTAYVLWGLTPLFWNLAPIDAVFLLLYRIVWSAPILLIVIIVRRQLRTVRSEYTKKTSRVTAVVSALLLTVNWGIYVWAVTNGHIIEASLGYFINPLVSIALGVLVLKERLRQLQWLAVGVAVVGVSAMGALSGVPPWISLALALSFGVYGLLKKRDFTPQPLISLFGETTVMFLPALALLLILTNPGDEAFGTSVGISVFFVSAGLITVVPLLLFGASAKRIPLSHLGFLQYIAPVLQLLIGLIVYREPITGAEMIGFATVWVALVVLTVDGRQRTTAIV